MEKYHHISFSAIEPGLEDFLKNKVVNFSISEIDKCYLYSFDLYDNSPFYSKVMSYIQKYAPISIAFISYSKQEILSAEWLMMESDWGKIEPPNNEAYDSIYTDLCTNHVSGCNFKIQNSLYRAKSAPKWQKNRNFCCDKVGGWHNIFCSNYAKEVIQSNGITGIEFLPVLHYKSLEPIDNINQIRITHTLSHNSFNFNPPPQINVCEKCGSISYVFEDLNAFEVIIFQTELELDAYKTPVCIGEGWGYNLNFISNKLYNVLDNILNEKSLCYKPVKIRGKRTNQ